MLTNIEVKEIGKAIALLHQGILKISSGITSDSTPENQNKLVNDAGYTEPFNRKNVLSEVWKASAALEDKKNHGIQLDEVQLTFLQLSKRLCDILESLPTREYKLKLQYPIHRDIRLSNIIWKDGKIVGIVDFENVSHMNDILYKDVAIAIQGACREPEFPCQSDSQKVRYLAEAYATHMQSEEANLRLVFDLITAGCIEDFSYLYWLYENDRRKFESISEGKVKGGLAVMKLYAESAIDHNDKRLMYFGDYNDNY